MQTQLGGIACRRLYTPGMILDNVLVLFEDGRISMMGDFNSAWIEPNIFNARGEGLVVVPGLIDTHMHGCSGCDFLDRTAESIATISATAARGGATTIVATTTVPKRDADLSGLQKFADLLRGAQFPGARVAGIHLEGPFLNPERRGGFGLDYVQPINLKFAEKMLEICGDLLLKVTVAPELENAADFIALIAEKCPGRVEVSLGHTAAGFELAQEFFQLPNVNQATHAFNAMNPFHHRDPNLIGAALLNDDVMVELIPDGHHLSGPAIELLYRIKGTGRLIAVTDSTGATATEPGTLVPCVGGMTMVKDGAVRLVETGALAGSNLLMGDALACLQKLGSIPFDHALQMCTKVPAKSINRESEFGSIDPQKCADFCVLRRNGSVLATIRDGLLVYAAT
ncbi:MAG: N-acetylglucosamine-6-phosphate deacetylase [Candidatus Sumerlaeaceae bacterium]|nr:N-acetylglucosamine-6-phosphate deacetylase [Candidatus Sumerlaeaceae bacterium]